MFKLNKRAEFLKMAGKCLAIIVLAASATGLFPALNANSTQIVQDSVVDIDVGIAVGSARATLVVGADGKLYATGQEAMGIFGDGGAPDDIRLGFSVVDTPQINEPIVDVISSVYRTTLLTASGKMYLTGGYDESYNTMVTFQQIDPALFGNSPVVKVNRNIHVNTILTADGNIYTTSDWQPGIVVYPLPLPIDGGNPVVPAQTMTGAAGAYLYLLDTSGKVWLADDFLSLTSGAQTTLNWMPTTIANNESVTIKQMVTIQEPYFLTTDGRIMFTNYFTDENGDFHFTSDLTTLDFTGIDNVAEFVPFYAPAVHSYFPNFRKTDGFIYVGQHLMDDLTGTSQDFPEAIVRFEDTFPGAHGAKFLTIDGYPNPISSGSFVVNGKLTAINGNSIASNGVAIDEYTLQPPLLTSLLERTVVINPALPILSGASSGNINPASITIGPAGASAIPIQARWQITKNGVVVTSGVKALTSGVAVIDVGALGLADGDYVISYFRETTDEYAAANGYMRSAETANATFVMATLNSVTPGVPNTGL